MMRRWIVHDCNVDGDGTERTRFMDFLDNVDTSVDYDYGTTDRKRGREEGAIRPLCMFVSFSYFMSIRSRFGMWRRS